MSTLTMVSPLGAESSDTVPQDADPLDLQFHDVAAVQPATVAVLEDAAGSDRAGAEDVAGPQVRVTRGVRDNCIPGVVHVGEVPARPLLAVDARDHAAALPVELVGGREDRPEARGEVLPLGGSE